MLRLAASLEQGSEHPLARAVMDKARLIDVAADAAAAFEAVSGKEVRVTVDAPALLGSPKFLAEQGVELDQPLAERLQRQGKTVVGVAKNGLLVGFIAIADQLRPSSRQAVAELKRLGVDVVMLTGDNQATAAAIAAQVSIDHFMAEVLPGDKGAPVNRLRQEGRRVGMVGDGINDAPALAAADVSFVIGAGSDIAIEATDVTLMKSDLMGVAEAIDLSRTTLKKIKQNLFFVFIYNVLGISLAAAGMLNPVIAGDAMAMSSVSVVSNSLLLRRWKPESARPPSAQA